MWEELTAIFKVDTKKSSFYWMAHAILILVAYEILIHLFSTPRVKVYNGADIWFAFFYHYAAPFGTLLFSIYFIMKYSFPIFQEWNGIKNTKEKKADKAVAGAFIQSRGGKDLMKAEGIKQPKPAPKAKFRPDWFAFFRLILEGLIYGAIIYVSLRFVVFRLTWEVLDGEVYIPTSIDNNTTLRNLHTNPLQDIALALGAGFYEEIIFRKYLYELLFKRMGRYFKPRSTTPNTKKVGIGIYSLILSILPAGPAKNEAELASVKLKKQVTAALLGSVIYSLSHFLLPFGDNFSTYTVFYRFFFGIIMSFLFIRRGFGVAAWTHIWYDLFYFWFWVE